jgi:hypothetical protein
VRISQQHFTEEAGKVNMIRKVKIIGVLTFGLLLARISGIAQTTVTQFQVNGLLTDYFGCDANGNCTIYGLSANTSGTFGPQYFFFYDVFTTNSSGQSVVYDGFGQIPADSVSRIGTSQVTLNVDTSQVSGFVNNVCMFDPVTGNSSCASGPGGVINVNWQKTNVFTVSKSGISRGTFAPNLIVNNDASATQSSATSSGTILGFNVVPGGVGELVSGHDGSITIQHQ